MSLITSIMRGGTNNHQTTSEEANGFATDFAGQGIIGAVANTSGVAPMTGGFAVGAQGSPDMTVAVASGVAYVAGTPTSQNAQTFRVKNTASANVTISANATGSTKYDFVYVKLDATLLNNPNVAGDSTATLVVSRSSNSTTDDGTPPTYGYAIARVTVANGAPTITNANIADLRARVALNTGVTSSTDGWLPIANTALSVSTGYNKGNKEFDIATSTDLSGTISPGMRLKVSRGTTPPTQCADLESGSSQYASKASPTGVTFTDDFTCEAWVKPESYGAQVIVSRYNGTSGWELILLADGTISIRGYNASSANFRRRTTYQSVPLGRWVHIAATLDMSGATGTIYIDGVLVPALQETGGTNPTALVQAGDLDIGARSGGTVFLDAKIADVRVWSAIRTATEIRDNMNQQVSGSATNLVSYFKLDGNFNDATANANNLTGQGGAVATNVDNPMRSTEYAIVMKVTTTTLTVFTGTDYNIPNMTLNTPYYSLLNSPYGFNTASGRWRVNSLLRTSSFTTSNANYGAFLTAGYALSVPTGDWVVGHVGGLTNSSTTTVYFNISKTALTGLANDAGYDASPFATFTKSAAAANSTMPYYLSQPQSLDTQATYVMYTLGAATTAALNGTNTLCEIFAECAYI